MPPMKISPKTIPHEQFKTAIKEWLDSHQDEYIEFSTAMDRKDPWALSRIMAYASSMAKDYASALAAASVSRNGDAEFEKLEKLLIDAKIDERIVGDFYNGAPDTIAPAMLAWLYFGPSWEVMVTHNEAILREPNVGFFKRMMARVLVQMTIKRSISLGHRTKDDWDNFRRNEKKGGTSVPVTESVLSELDSPIQIMDEQKNQEPKKRGRKCHRVPLSELIVSEPEKIVGKISGWLHRLKSGQDVALLFIFLKEEGHVAVHDATAFHHAMTGHFPAHDFVGVRSMQKECDKLETSMAGGRRMLDFYDDTRMKFEAIRAHFAA